MSDLFGRQVFQRQIIGDLREAETEARRSPDQAHGVRYRRTRTRNADRPCAGIGAQ
jgi:hypothetical protein